MTKLVEKRKGIAKQVLSITLLGKIPSKKNAWRRRASGGVFLDRELKTTLDDFVYQLISTRNGSPLKMPLNGSVRVEACFYVRSIKSDLDNVYTTFQDLLQASGIIKNDNQVEQIFLSRVKSAVDKTVAKIYRI